MDFFEWVTPDRLQDAVFDCLVHLRAWGGNVKLCQVKGCMKQLYRYDEPMSIFRDRIAKFPFFRLKQEKHGNQCWITVYCYSDDVCWRGEYCQKRECPLLHGFSRALVNHYHSGVCKLEDWSKKKTTPFLKVHFHKQVTDFLRNNHASSH